MPLASIHNRKGFFSDYWLGTLASARGAGGARLTPAQARRALERLRRGVEAVDGIEPPDLTHLRERLARPLFEDVLGQAGRKHRGTAPAAAYRRRRWRHVSHSRLCVAAARSRCAGRAAAAQAS